MRHVIFSLILLLPGLAHADEASMEKFYGWLPEQILEMPEEERRSSVPMAYIWAANTLAIPAGELIIGANLNTLMYNGLADTEAAIRAFQLDLGDEPTGKLSVGQIHELGYRSERFSLTDVGFFPFDFGGWMSETYAEVQGTVEILGDRIAYPINHVWVRCDRSEGTCKYHQIVLSLPDDTSFAQSYHVSELADDTYRITRWEGQQIDAVPLDATACRINQLSFNFATEEFFEIARNNTEGDCETMLGVTLPRLEQPRISQIVDGREITEAEFDTLSEEAYGYLSSDFRAKLEAATGNTEVEE